eukprot:COSAG01_NODE_724_length_14056_cov_41.795443_14_plen_135_part_00
MSPLPGDCQRCCYPRRLNNEVVGLVPNGPLIEALCRHCPATTSGVAIHGASIMRWIAQVTALRRACARLDLAYRPKLTVVGVQRHHHTRFFAESPQVRLLIIFVWSYSPSFIFTPIHLTYHLRNISMAIEIWVD